MTAITAGLLDDEVGNFCLPSDLVTRQLMSRSRSGLAWSSDDQAVPAEDDQGTEDGEQPCAQVEERAELDMEERLAESWAGAPGYPDQSPAADFDQLCTGKPGPSRLSPSHVRNGHPRL
jgi:hypothetical protein